jgi:hypothetical protein
LRYLKNLLGFAFRMSVGGNIFGFNVAPSPPTLRLLPGKPSGADGGLEGTPPGTGGNLEEKPPDGGGGCLVGVGVREHDFAKIIS